MSLRRHHTNYDVFISHAGPDKLAVAEPLFKCLNDHHVPTFLDMEGLQIHEGTAPEEMTRAMEQARVAIFILSPEFAAKEWPLKELRFFLERDRLCKAQRRRRPVLLPLFYRLSLSDCAQADTRIYGDGSEHRELLERKGFFRTERQAECSTQQAVAAFQQLRTYSGVEMSRIGGGEDLSSAAMVSEAGRRVFDYLKTKKAVKTTHVSRADIGQGGNEEDVYRCCVDVPENPPHVVLNFQTALELGEAGAGPVNVESELKAAVLRNRKGACRSIEEAGSSFSQAVGMEGMSGVGKSCALRGLARDSEVRERFYDGIYFINLGKDSTKGGVVREIAKIIETSGGQRKSKGLLAEESVGAAVRVAKSWFKGKRILLLIDDVWDETESGRDILAGLCGVADVSQGSCIAFTTQLVRVAARSAQIHFSARDGKAAREILLGSARLREGDVKDCRAAVEDVLGFCSGLPMALAIAGSAVLVRRCFVSGRTIGEILDEYLGELRTESESLLESQVGNDSYPNLASTFAVSLSILGKSMADVEIRMSVDSIYRTLVVLRRKGWIPIAVVDRLWETGDEQKALCIVNKLAEANLAQREDRMVNGKKMAGISLHDLQLMYVQRECEKHGEDKTWHLKLVLSYLSDEDSSDSQSTAASPTHGWWRNLLCCLALQEADGSSRCNVGAREWCTDDILKNEYLRNNLSRHLMGAGLEEDLWKVLKNPKWAANRLRNHEMLSLEEDFERIRQYLLSKQGGELGYGSEVWVLGMIAGAVRLSWPYVSYNPREVWFQLYARLFRRAQESEAIRAYATGIEGCAERPWVKALTACLTEANLVLRSIAFCDGKVEWISQGNGGESGKLFACVRKDDGCVCVITIVNGLVENTVVLSMEEESACADVSAVCCTRDGSRAATGHVDGTVWTWDLQTGESVSSALRGHSSEIWCVAWSPDGTRVASGSLDETMRIWDVQAGKAVGGAMGHNSTIWCAAWSADGMRVASGSELGTVRIWDAQTGEAVGDALSGLGWTIKCVAWSADGTRVAAGADDGSLWIWDVQTGDAISSPRYTHCSIKCIAWSADGTRVTTGADDGTVQIWDSQIGNKVGRVLDGHGWNVKCIAWSGDGTRVFSGADDGTVRIWDTHDRETTSIELDGHSWEASCVALSTDGTRVALGKNRTVQIRDAEAGEVVSDARNGHKSDIQCVVWSADGKRVASGADDGTVCIWDAQTGECLRTEEGWGMTNNELVTTLDGEDRAPLEEGRDGVCRLKGSQVVLDRGVESSVLATFDYVRAQPTIWDLSRRSGKIAFRSRDGNFHFLQLVE